ncbi:MAG: tetratricopeptide repeat protein [Acidiferrobacterales bacterium]
MRLRNYTENILIIVVFLCACAFLPLRAEDIHEFSPRDRAQLFWRQGYALHLVGEYDQAIAHFSKSIDLYPTAEGYTFRGWSLSMLGRLNEAIAECKQAIELDPDYGNPYNDIGVYLIDLGHPDEAIPWFKKAMRAKRYCCYQYPHFNMGRILLMKGRVSAAVQSFERALSYDPNYEYALKALEIIREQGFEAI